MPLDSTVAQINLPYIVNIISAMVLRAESIIERRRGRPRCSLWPAHEVWWHARKRKIVNDAKTDKVVRP